MALPSMDINPNTNGPPSNAALEKIVGALMRFELNAAVAGVAPSVIARAVGSHSANFLQIYRKCVTGQDVARQARRGSVGAHGVRKGSGRSLAETSGRIRGEALSTSVLTRSPLDHTKSP
jgi:hypothetical protein